VLDKKGERAYDSGLKEAAQLYLKDHQNDELSIVKGFLSMDKGQLGDKMSQMLTDNINRELVAREIIEEVLNETLKDGKMISTDVIKSNVKKSIESYLSKKNSYGYCVDYYNTKIEDFFARPEVAQKFNNLMKEKAIATVDNNVKRVQSLKCNEYTNDELNVLPLPIFGVVLGEDGKICLRTRVTNTRAVLNVFFGPISSLIFELLDYLGITESSYSVAMKNAEAKDAKETIKAMAAKRIELMQNSDELLTMFRKVVSEEQQVDKADESKPSTSVQQSLSLGGEVDVEPTSHSQNEAGEGSTGQEPSAPSLPYTQVEGEPGLPSSVAARDGLSDPNPQVREGVLTNKGNEVERFCFTS
jgi:hypothetical protein